MPKPSEAVVNIDEIFPWLCTFTNLETVQGEKREYRLDRMDALLDRLGRPEKSCPLIHIAGSKGKGSTVALCAKTLANLGFKVGIYASPHILDWRERICIPGGFFSDVAYCRAAIQVKQLVSELETDPGWHLGKPTTFELLTLMCFMIFRDSHIEIGVIETGLGGRLDATNLIQPLASIITHLELEHTDILGPTITHIAREKGGIFKPGIPAFSAPQIPEAWEVLTDCAIQKSTTLRLADTSLPQEAPPIPMPFFENACLVWTVLSTIIPQHFPDVQSDVIDAFVGAIRGSRPLGRCTWFENPAGLKVMVDGAHTLDSINLALQNFQRDLPAKTASYLLFGMVEGKNIQGISPLFNGRFTHIMVTRPGSFKASNPLETFRTVQALCPDSSVQLEISEAMAWKVLYSQVQNHGSSSAILVLGSFHLLGMILPILQEEGFVQCP